MEYSTGAHGGVEQNVQTAHSYTGRMCAASRWIESNRADALFVEPQAYKLAGSEGRAQPMGDWIMVPRTRYGDDLIEELGKTGASQLVLLGAGMDTRAFRLATYCYYTPQLFIQLCTVELYSLKPHAE